MKLFVDTDSDTRLSRRVLRDIQERNRSVDSVLKQYLRYVKPAFDEYILPVSWGGKKKRKENKRNDK